MKCPFCGKEDTRVIDSRPADDGLSIRRRRQCDSCDKRFTTYEKIETIPNIVIKKDDRREQYKREKIIKGILASCHKRPVSINTVNEMTDEIESEIFASDSREIPSHVIGEKIMEKLQKVDQVAYVRFASVYREFQDVDTFLNELQKVIKKHD